MAKSISRSLLLFGTATGAMAAAAVATPAMAQDNPLDQAVEQENQIVVTGSRIVRRDLQANSPLVTVGEDAFENRASPSVEDALNDLPQFATAGSASALSGSATAFSGPQQAPGAATLNLRGLGTNRTLVLVNGRRAQPVNAQLVIDVNTIPSAAIANVEVITGGAAAVYGADAIAGVVNFKLKDNFEGIEVSGQAGIAEVGDGENYQVSALVGGNFGDGRGNAMFGIVWNDREAAYQRNRDFYTNGWQDPLTSAAGGGLPVNVAVVGGVNWGVNYDGTLFRTDRAQDPAAPFKGPLGALAGGAGFKLNPSTSANQTLGYTTPTALINVPLTRYSMYGAAHYDLTDAITVFVEGNYSHSTAYAQSFAGQASTNWALSVPYNAANDDPDSPTFGANQSNFHPVSGPLADLLNARAAVGGVPGTMQNWTLSRGLNFLGELNVQTTSDIFQLTAGLRGDVGFSDWTWEVYGSHGSTNVVASQPEGAISHPNLQQLIQGTTKDVSGQVIGRSGTINGPWSAGWSNGSTFNPSTCTSGIGLFNADGSVPQALPGTGEGVVVSDDCKDYATLELNNVTQINQTVVEGTVQGKLIQWWGGEVRFAAGATYRKADFSYAPDTGNSGEQANISVVNQIALPKPTAGGVAVREAYGELLIPLVHDLPLVKSFELELGGRYSDYDRSGQIFTYKILGNWEVTDWLRFRGGYQKANRAPNIYEQFAPIAGAIGGSLDVCMNLGTNTPTWGNRSNPEDLAANVNPNIINLQEACKALIVRDGGYAYQTLKDDPTAVGQSPSLYPNLDITRISNLRDGGVIGYNGFFPFSIALEQGNPDLDSEKADTITAGLVLNSPFEAPLLQRITLTVDYYSVNLKGTIATPSGTEIYTQCLNPLYNKLIASPAGSLSGTAILEGNPYCALINRFPYNAAGVLGAPGGGAGADRSYDAKYINKGGTKTAGIDIALNWAIPIGSASLNLNAAANILLKYEDQAFPGAAWIDYKGTAQNQAFDYKISGGVTYQGENLSVGVRGQYLPRLDPLVTAAVGTTGSDPHVQFDLFGRYQVNDLVEVRAGIDNVLNAQPEIFGATPTNNNALATLPVYDTFGRAFYLGAKFRM